MTDYKKFQRWCNDSGRVVLEYPAGHRPQQVDDTHYICPNCGRTVGVRSTNAGSALARHFKQSIK